MQSDQHLLLCTAAIDSLPLLSMYMSSIMIKHVLEIGVTYHSKAVILLWFSVACFCPPPFRSKAEGHSFRLSVCPSFRLYVPLKFYVPCVRNSSYSFMPIHLKLYRCFCHGLKICMWFGYYPEIIFCHFFRSLNLAII